MKKSMNANIMGLPKSEWKDLIDESAAGAANKVVAELKKQSFLKGNKISAFQKTEHLLYNYNNFKDAINDKHEQIETIKNTGLPRKSKSITSFGGTGMNTDTEIEKIEDKVEALKASIVLTNKFIDIIDAALDKLSGDAYYPIIQMKYFEGKSREAISEKLEVDVSTITRNKNRLINTLKISLFSDEVIMEIFN